MSRFLPFGAEQSRTPARARLTLSCLRFKLSDLGKRTRKRAGGRAMGDNEPEEAWPVKVWASCLRNWADPDPTCQSHAV